MLGTVQLNLWGENASGSQEEFDREMFVIAGRKVRVSNG
jgi:hypothetical protein